MATSNTYEFNPSLGELTLYAFNLVGLRSSSLLQEHFQNARTAANMVLANWSNKGVNLWTVDLQTINLVQGTATYNVDPSTVSILDAYVVLNSGTSPIDRLILPISRSEYAAYPNKTQQAAPTTFWFDRKITPTITLWPVPDGSSAAQLKFYRMRRIQDSNLQGAENVEIPYLWMEAFAIALAFRLAAIWKPEVAPGLKAWADESYNTAADQNVETSNVYISPQISGYWRV